MFRWMLETKKANPKQFEDKKALDFKIDTKAITELGQFTAYASVFGNADWYGDIVEKGAFKKTIKNHKANDSMPALLWQHDCDEVCGKILEAKEDDYGLLITGQFNLDSDCGKNTYATVKAGDVKTLSIGFNTMAWEPIDAKSPFDGRLLKELELWECSIVTFPANMAAKIQAVKGQRPTIREFEGILMREGFTRKDAQTISTKGFKALCVDELEPEAMRDAGQGDDDEEGVLTQEEIESLELEAFGILTKLVV